jgi:putative phage-type endonuclease
LGSQRHEGGATDYPEYSEARRWQQLITLVEQEMEQRTEEWFEARKGRITASSVGAILGNAPYATRDDVMRRMVREWHGAPNEFEGNIATEYGTRNEAGALTEYVLETGNRVDAVGFITRDDWAGCSPDGLIADSDRGLEIKCPFGLRKDEVPTFKTLADQPHYYDQVQFSMYVTGRVFWDFYQWTPRGTKLETVGVDHNWQSYSLPRLRQFYAEYLAEREDPSIHLEPKRQVIDTPEAHRVMSEYQQICDALENAEARKKELLAEMVRMAGEKDSIFAGHKLTKTERAGSVSYAKAIKELMPDADLEKWRGKPTSFWGIK